MVDATAAPGAYARQLDEALSTYEEQIPGCIRIQLVERDGRVRNIDDQRPEKV